MSLVRLEIRNYRSIRDQHGDDQIEFGGLDCLIGRNNAGKSNILKCIVYLVEGEQDDASLHFARDRDNEIEVRGFFEISDDDFDRMKLREKRPRIEERMIDAELLGICRRSSNDELELLGYYPVDERLHREVFDQFHKDAWDNKSDNSDFHDRMSSEYPELVDFLREGKEQNKGEWSGAYDQLILARPDGIEFSLQPGPFPTGITADIKNLLPKIIFIPAVKEVAESTKTTRRAELGALLNELSDEIQEELDQAITDAMTEVYGRLNVLVDDETGEASDDRHRGVVALESRISNYVAETFQEIGISLEFPNPESQTIFRNARVWIEEGEYGRFPVHDVGEGVKRVLIFSLLRTLSDLRSGRLSVREERTPEEPKATHPLLVLYEEAELFLHPGLQRILLKVFQTLSDSGDHIIFTTHSPFMVQDYPLKTINLVSKESEIGTKVVEFHSVVRQQEPRAQERLLRIQNVSSYIFADRVLLVEGHSDRLVLEKLAPALNAEWSFVDAGIPILPVAGKGDLVLFQKLLFSLGIRPFVVTDIDAVEETILELCDDAEVRALREKLIESADSLIEAEVFPAKANRKLMKGIISKDDWEDVFDAMAELRTILKDGGEPEPRHLKYIDRLLLQRRVRARREAFRSDHEEITPTRNSMSKLLIERDILMLRGSIESYYDNSGGNKIDRALEFDPSESSPEDLRTHFCRVNDETDMEAFLERVFSN